MWKAIVEIHNIHKQPSSLIIFKIFIIIITFLLLQRDRKQSPLLRRAFHKCIQILPAHCIMSFRNLSMARANCAHGCASVAYAFFCECNLIKGGMVSMKRQ